MTYADAIVKRLLIICKKENITSRNFVLYPA